MKYRLLLALSIAPSLWAQAAAPTPLKADETVKDPLGFKFDRPMANQAACTAAYPALYAGAVAQAKDFCVKWYTCPEGAPTYSPLLNQAQACKCAAGFQGMLTATCDVEWNGLCGCQSPSGPASLINPNVPLTDLEINQMKVFYPLASRNLTALLKARPQALATFTQAYQSYLDGKAFTVKPVAAGGFDVFLAPSYAAVAKVTAAALSVRIGKGGAATITEHPNLPGGVRRTLLSALAAAFAQ